jgi:uncharacterized protein YbaP (TraB family)
LFCFAVGQVRAEPGGAARAQPPRGALFQVTQDGHTLYLFGTIHVGAPDFFPLEPRLTAALQQSRVLALEIDPLGDETRMAQAIQRHGMVARGAQRSELSPAYRARLARLLQQYRIPPESVAMMKPWLLASLLTVNEFAAQGYDVTLAVDAWLARQAHERKQQVLELESPDSQMALFNRMTSSEQLRFLEESIDGIDDKEQADQARQIAQAWRNADRAGLDAVAAKAGQDQTFSGRFVQRVLLDGRNPALADGIARLLQQEQISVAAIGVLHLLGSNSVPELLRKRGLAVERIY